MKATIKALTIAVFVLLLVIAATGCREGKESGSSADKTQKNTSSQNNNQDNTGKSESPQENQSQSTAITLYFSDDQAEFLIPETREVVEAENIAKVAVEELVKGPRENGLHATIPSETKVLGVEIENNIAYVDFSRDLIDKHWGGSTGELMTIMSTVNTLTEFENIHKVQILVEGKVIETITGHSDVSQPFARFEEVIKN